MLQTATFIITLFGLVALALLVQGIRGLGMNRRGMWRGGSFNPLIDHNWYVDSVNGSDSNDGLTAVTAFATIAKLQTVLGAGDTVGLVRGSHWRESLGNVGGGFGTTIPNGCKFFAVGTGRLPILDSSDIVDMGTAVRDATHTNLWKFMLTTEHNMEAPESFTRVFRTPSGGSILTDHVALWRTADLTTANSTPSSFHVVEHATNPLGPHEVYVHAPGSVDPTADGAVYEMVTRGNGFSGSGATGLRVNGMRCRRGLSTNAPFQLDHDPVQLAENVVCEDGCQHGFFMGVGETINCWSIGTPDNSAITGGTGVGFLSFNNTSGNKIIHRRPIVVSTVAPTSTLGVTAIFNHGGSTDVEIYDGKAANVRSAFNIVDCNSLIMHRFAGWKLGGGTGFSAGSTDALTGEIKHTRLYAHQSDFAGPTNGMNLPITAPASVDIEDCLFAVESLASRIALNRPAGVGALTLRARRSAFLHLTTGTGFVGAINLAGVAGSDIAELQNNLFYMISSDGRAVRANAGVTVSDSDNNHYSTNAWDYMVDGTNQTTISAHQTANAPLDANSTVGAVTVTDDQALQRETAGMIRFSGHNGKGPDMTNWNEELDPDTLLAAALAL